MWHLRGGGPVRRRLRLLLGGALVSFLIVAVFLGDSPPARSDGAPEVRPEVLQALRLLLSDDPKEEARGEQLIRKLGGGAIPDLRNWTRRVRLDLDRVASLFAEIEGREPGSPSAENLSAGEFLSRKVAECRALNRKGDHTRALALAEALLLLDRQNPYSWELRRLVRRARERLVMTEVLLPSVEVGKYVYEVGGRPDVAFRITNRDSRVARIRLDRGVLGELSLTVTKQYIDGGMKREETRLRIQVAEDVDQILIGPGLSWEHPLRVEGIEDLPPEGVVVRVQAAGRFRPTRWTVDREDRENIGLPMGTAEFWIVPKGQSTLCDRPLEKLTASLFFMRLESIFVGGQLAVWAGEEDPYFNESLVRTLIESLEELDPPARRLADRFLMQATGRDEKGDPAGWKAWWGKAVAERAGLAPTPQESPEP